MLRTHGAVAALMLLAFVTARAQPAAPPDFSGVYYPILRLPAGLAPPAADRQKGPPPRPTQSAPLADGSQGRAPNSPQLTPEYMAQCEVI